MRALHVITRLIGGGAERNTDALILFFNEDGRQKHDLFTGAESRPECLNNYRNINLHVSKHLVRSINPIKDLFCLFELIRFIKKNRYDIVHTHLAKAGAIARVASWLAGVKTVIHTVHGSTFYRGQPRIFYFWFWFLEKILSFFTTRFIFVGYDLLDWYKRHGICRDEHSVIIRSAIDIDKFLDARKQRENGFAASFKTRFSIEPHHFIIATVATFEKRKCLDDVIKIASHLKQRGQLENEMKFLLIGRGAEEARLKHLAKQNGIERDVLFLGFHEDIENLFVFFDIFLFTSKWEGLPQVFVQANIVGVPILTFDVEGAREMVRPGINGFIFERSDFFGIENKIVELFKNKTRLSQISNQRPHIPLREWRLDEVIRRTSEIYTF